MDLGTGGRARSSDPEWGGRDFLCAAVKILTADGGPCFEVIYNTKGKRRSFWGLLRNFAGPSFCMFGRPALGSPLYLPGPDSWEDLTAFNPTRPNITTAKRAKRLSGFPSWRGILPRAAPLSLVAGPRQFVARHLCGGNSVKHAGAATPGGTKQAARRFFWCVKINKPGRRAWPQDLG
ncbi:unnamed protein product [Amoebophrya sp. A120]|nr:unnamed protein product [Amoebophrya sp. A120]|eukprot:GSA120T00011959001.1